MPGKIVSLLIWLTTLAGSFLLIFACIGYFWLIWPLLDMLSIIVPALWGICTMAGIYWLFANWKRSFLPLFALLLSVICFPGYAHFWPVGPGEAGDASLRIASYNSGNLYPASGPWRKLKNDLQKMTDSLGADVICFQEIKRDITRRLNGYPYRFFAPVVPGKSDQAIFSEYPIIGSGTVDFADSSNNAIYADIVVHGDTIRIYNVHLQSYRIRSGRYLMRDYGKPMLRRVSDVAKRHMEQAALVKSHQEGSGLRTVICGDFNATAFSHAYQILRRGMLDTFAEKGQGLGATFFRRGVPFRIDYILTDPAFEVQKHQVYDLPLSDHFPITATLQLH